MGKSCRLCDLCMTSILQDKCHVEHAFGGVALVQVLWRHLLNIYSRRLCPKAQWGRTDQCLLRSYLSAWGHSRVQSDPSLRTLQLPHGYGLWATRLDASFTCNLIIRNCLLAGKGRGAICPSLAAERPFLFPASVLRPF